jgi:tubulin-specific chaperone E
VLNGMSLHVGSTMDHTKARDTSSVCVSLPLQLRPCSLILHPGQSPSPTAASFLRTTRVKDEEQSFLEAVRAKYAPEDPSRLDTMGQIEISGKVVEEVGFDKIREQQSQLHELKIVLVDGMRINKAQYDPRKHLEISIVCPNIVELDLSRNLFENFRQILEISKHLVELRKLRLK